VRPKVVKSIRERSIMVNARVWLVDQAIARVKAIARVATNATVRLVFMGMLLFVKKSNRSARRSSRAVAHWTFFFAFWVVKIGKGRAYYRPLIRSKGTC